MQILILLVLLFSNCVLIKAQDLNLSAIMSDPGLYPERLSQMQWAKKNNTFYYVKGSELIAVNVKGKVNKVFDLPSLNIHLEKIGFSQLNRFPTLDVISDEEILFWSDSTLIKCNFIKRTISIVNSVFQNAENIQIDYNSYNVAFTLENNLYVSINNKIIPISQENDKGIVYGTSVHRNEFGIDKGIFWSPKGRYMAFYRMDETMVSDYPLVDIVDPIASVDFIKYPMAGSDNHKVTLGIFDIERGNKIYINTKHWEDQYLTNISWSPDEKHIYIAVLHRNQKELMLNQYDVKTGHFVKTIFTETSDKYVEPLNPLFFISESSQKFIWQSVRDGYNHLYLYDINNETPKKLTEGEWNVNKIVSYDSEKGILFFIASKEKPIESELYALRLNDLNLIKLSKNNGVNNAMGSFNSRYLVNIVSSIQIPNKVVLMDNNGKEISVLLNSSLKSNEALAKTEIFSLKANDGITDLYCRIIKPSDFDPLKKYPVIIYVYGGPHAQMVKNSWTANAGLFLHYLAKQGYIVFTLDNRGSANRGMKFEQAIYKNAGDIEVQDQMTGVDFLKSLSYIDTSRIGVHGWSYGGYMTMMMMFKHPEVFNVGVAGGPVTDWKYYEIMYGERYMGTPEDNEHGYSSSSLLNKVAHLKGKLLVIHGDKDPVVVWQHSLMLLKNSLKEGVIIDYSVYPGHEHGVGGMDRVHLMKRIETYFKDFL